MNTRERFEAWAESFGWNIDRTDEGQYRVYTTDVAWGAWCGAAEEMKKAHAKKCRDWADICRSNKRHGCSVGANECAKLILMADDA